MGLGKENSCQNLKSVGDSKWDFKITPWGSGKEQRTIEDRFESKEEC